MFSTLSNDRDTSAILWITLLIIRIGKNITDFAWDGRDEYGNELAKGVYFYRVITRLNGQELDRFSKSDNNGKYNMSSTAKMDKLFGKHGIGKMYKL